MVEEAEGDSAQEVVVGEEAVVDFPLEVVVEEVVAEVGEAVEVVAVVEEEVVWEEERKLLLNHTDMRESSLLEERKMLW